MKRKLSKMFLVAALMVAYASCDDGELSSLSNNLPVRWEVLPEDELANVKEWYEDRLEELPAGTKSSEIMWGTARYHKAGKNGYVMAALVADTNDKVIKTAYIFKRDESYSAYVLGNTIDKSRAGITDNYTGELTLFDLEGGIRTSSVLENGRTVLSKSNARKGLSNFRTAIEDDPIILQEVVIESTRIESNTTWMIMSSLTYFDLSHFFPGYRYDGYTGGVHHYAAPVSNTEDVIIFDGGPIINIDCVKGKFSDGKSPRKYTVTIYIDQPKPGTREKWAWSDNGDKFSAGHTFIGLRKENTDGTAVEYLVGYYPLNNDVSPITGDVVDTGGFRNNNSTAYDVSISYTVSAWQFNDALDYLDNFPGTTYNLNTQNCSDVGVGCAAAIGRTLPDTFGTWSGGGGTNPADLGEDVRAMPNSSLYTVNRTGGTARSLTPSGC
jgi:hypothetical protein